jgi:hypothetical protein
LIDSRARFDAWKLPQGAQVVKPIRWAKIPGNERCYHGEGFRIMRGSIVVARRYSKVTYYGLRRTWTVESSLWNYCPARFSRLRDAKAFCYFILCGGVPR